MKIVEARDYVVNNLKYALDPKSIAVVGASRYLTKVGYKPKLFILNHLKF